MTEAELLTTGTFNLTAHIKETELRFVKLALDWCGDNRYKAAKLLGINRTTLVEKIRRFGLPMKPRSLKIIDHFVEAQ
jgi:DNA-binding protein Fis